MSSREVPTNFPAGMTQRYEEGGEQEAYAVAFEPPSGRPFSPTEALMQAAPGEPVETSQMEMLALRDTIADAIDRLSPRHKWVLEQNLIARVPVRTLGEWMGLGKSYVWMIKQEALALLREDLKDHPAIVAYLGRHDEIEDDE